jgi:uncharacterized protein YigA (DUF484 family)
MVEMMDPDTRDQILAKPEALLDDPAVMQALIDAHERTLGGNIVDLRGLAMERLEQRLDRLEDTHRSVISAAYENLAGSNQVNRAILQLLEPMDFARFLAALNGTIAATLRVDRLRLVLHERATGKNAEPGEGDVYVVFVDGRGGSAVDTARVQVRP